MIAPIIPGLTDHELPGILRAASEAGATSAIRIVLRLPHQLKTLFFDWVQRHYSERAGRIERQVRSLHGGKLYDATFGRRGRGTGPLADQIARTFEVFSRRYGLAGEFPPLSSASFCRPALDGQLPLFDDPASATS
jgi:DNA repair photolyase